MARASALAPVVVAIPSCSVFLLPDPFFSLFFISAIVFPWLGFGLRPELPLRGDGAIVCHAGSVWVGSESVISQRRFP